MGNNDNSKKEPYTTKELVAAIEQVYAWFCEGYEVPEDIADKMQVALRWINSKVPENIPPMQGADFQGMTQDIKEGVQIGANQLRAVYNKPYLFKRKFASLMVHMYNAGIADALGGEVVEEGTCFKIEKGKIYEAVCPMCGETIGLDFSEYVKKGGGYGVRV